MMHDIDRTLAELEAEDDADILGTAEFELEDGDWRELEYEHEYEDEYEDEDEFELEDEDEYEYDVVLSDDEELELASDLLNVSDEEELEYFLGKLFRKVGRTARRAYRRGRRLLKRGVPRKLRRALKRVAKRALPIGGAAVGGVFGGPLGATVGGRAAPSVGRIFGLELEGLGPEDQELEAARRFVRMATSATSNAIRGSQTPASPQRIVRTSLKRAARRHAPGLLRPAPGPALGKRRHRRGRQTRGSWVRRGNTIVLLGV